MAKISDIYGSQEFEEASANGWLQGYVEEEGVLRQAKYQITDIAKLGQDATDWIDDVGAQLEIDVQSGISALNWIDSNEQNIKDASATTSATYSVLTATDKAISGNLSAGLSLDFVTLHDSANKGKEAYDYINSAKYTFKYDNVDENNGTGSLKNGLTFDFKGSKFEQEILDQIKLKQAYKYTSEALPNAPTDEQKTWIWVSGNGVLTADKCDEYIWDANVNNWVMIGTTQLDLTDLEDSASKGAMVYNQFKEISGDLVESAENGQDAYEWITDNGNYLIGSAKSGAYASAWINKSASDLETSVSNAKKAIDVLQSAKLTIVSGGTNYTANLSSSPSINLESLYGSAKSGAYASAWASTNSTRISNIESSAQKASAWIAENNDKVTASNDWIEKNKQNIVDASGMAKEAKTWIDTNGEDVLDGVANGNDAKSWVDTNGKNVLDGVANGNAAKTWVNTNGKNVLDGVANGNAAKTWIDSNGTDLINDARKGANASAWIEQNEDKFNTLNDATIKISTGNAVTDVITGKVTANPVFELKDLYASAKNGQQAYNWTNSAVIKYHTASNHTASAYVKNGIDIDLSNITNASESGRVASAWIKDNETRVSNIESSAQNASAWIGENKEILEKLTTASFTVTSNGKVTVTKLFGNPSLNLTNIENSAKSGVAASAWIDSNKAGVTSGVSAWDWIGKNSGAVSSGSYASAWLASNGDTIKNNASSGKAASAWINSNGANIENSAKSGAYASAWLASNGANIENSAKSGKAASAWIASNGSKISGSAVNGEKAYQLITATNGINDKIAALENFNAYIVVSALPEASAKPSKNKIYLLTAQGAGETTDKCKEYVYTDNGWIKIGDVEISTTNFVNTTSNTWTSTTASAANGKQAYNWINSATISVTTATNKSVTANIKNGFSLDLTTLYTSAMHGQDAYQSVSSKVDKTSLKNYTIKLNTGTASTNTADITINPTASGSYSGIATSEYVTSYVASVSSYISTANSAAISTDGAKNGSAKAIAALKSATLYYTTSTAGDVASANYLPTTQSLLNTSANPLVSYKAMTGYLSTKSASIANAGRDGATGALKSLTVSSLSSRGGTVTKTAYTPTAAATTNVLASTAYVNSIDLWNTSSNGKLYPRYTSSYSIMMKEDVANSHNYYIEMNKTGFYVSGSDVLDFENSYVKINASGIERLLANYTYGNALFVDRRNDGALNVISGTEYESNNNPLKNNYNYVALRSNLSQGKWLGYSFFDYSSNRGVALEFGYSNGNKSGMHYGFHQYTNNVTDEFKNSNSGECWSMQFNPYNKTCTIYGYPVLKQSAITWETYVEKSASLSNNVYYIVT